MRLCCDCVVFVCVSGNVCMVIVGVCVRVCMFVNVFDYMVVVLRLCVCFLQCSYGDCARLRLYTHVCACVRLYGDCVVFV